MTAKIPNRTPAKEKVVAVSGSDSRIPKRPSQKDSRHALNSDSYYVSGSLCSRFYCRMHGIRFADVERAFLARSERLTREVLRYVNP